MKRVLAADFFELRKSKMVFILPVAAILLGFFTPMMYFGLREMFRYLCSLEMFRDQVSLTSSAAMFEALDAKTVFLSALPLSQGIGLIIAAMIGFRAVRPFSTGIYRNKIIAQIKREEIYLSQSLLCLILSMVSASLFTLTAALTSRMTFGSLCMTGREYLTVALLSFGVYLVYTAIPVFIAFLTRSVPLTLVISMVLPVIMQLVVSLAATALMSAPKIVTDLFAVLPSVQNVYMTAAQASDTTLVISMVSDVAITALLTVIGILRFKKTDMN